MREQTKPARSRKAALIAAASVSVLTLALPVSAWAADSGVPVNACSVVDGSTNVQPCSPDQSLPGATTSTTNPDVGANAINSSPDVTSTTSTTAPGSAPASVLADTTAVSPSSTGALAFTGADIAGTLGIGAVLIAIGGVTLYVRRRTTNA